MCIPGPVALELRHELRYVLLPLPTSVSSV